MGVSDWYAKKLNGQPKTTHEYTPGNFVAPNQNVKPTVNSLSSALENGLGPNESVKAGDIQNCPSCGSRNFFARKFGSIMGPGGLVPPAPECFDCGFPLRQTGSG